MQTTTESIEALRAKCALLAASLAQAEQEADDLRAGLTVAPCCAVKGHTPGSRYTIGVDVAAPFAVTLTIHTANVDAGQFRADLPRIAAKLEQLIEDARNDAAQRQGESA